MSTYTVSPHEYINGANVVEEKEQHFVKPKTVHVLVTPDRVDKIPMRYWESVEKGTISGMIEMSAWFLADERGVFYSHSEGLEIIRDMPRRQALEMVETISSHIQEVSAGKK